MILKLQKFKGTTAQYIILFFALLPVIDTLNGIMHSIPIGLLYKGFLCILLFFNILMRKVRIQQKFVKIFAGSIAYMFFGITCNIILNGSLISMDFPVKLLFNIALMCLLGCNLENGYLSANAIFEILDKSSWIFLPCFLIPYVLGVGNQVYGSEMGYKAFFVSQNELSLVIVVMIFFAAYKLSLHLDFIGRFFSLLSSAI